MRGIIVGTGPSLTGDVIAAVNASSLPKFGCNLTYRDVDLDVLYANNKEFWAYYGDELAGLAIEKWAYAEEARQYGAHIIKGVWQPSLSKDPGVLHWGHSSGYELLGIAYHHGVREMILVGYDLKMPKGYNGFTRELGDGKRNYFGAYPKELEHWPKYDFGPNGEMGGLLKVYRTIDCADLALRIINCSPGSALDFFEVGRLEDYL